MAKEPTKAHKTNSNTMNSVLISPKSKQQIDKEYYQKNKEHKKQQRKARYQQDKKLRKPSKSKDT